MVYTIIFTKISRPLLITKEVEHWMILLNDLKKAQQNLLTRVNKTTIE